MLFILKHRIIWQNAELFSGNNIWWYIPKRDAKLLFPSKGRNNWTSSFSYSSKIKKNILACQGSASISQKTHRVTEISFHAGWVTSYVTRGRDSVSREHTFSGTDDINAFYLMSLCTWDRCSPLLLVPLSVNKWTICSFKKIATSYRSVISDTYDPN